MDTKNYRGGSFYLIGTLISSIFDITKIQSTVKHYKFIYGLMLFTFAVSVISSQANGRVDLYFLIFNNIGLYYVSALFGVFTIYMLSMKIEKCWVLEFFGRYSIIILCTSEQIKRVIIKIMSILTRIPDENIRNNIFGGILITLVVFSIEYIVIKVIVCLAKLMKKTKFGWLLEYVK